MALDAGVGLGFGAVIGVLAVALVAALFRIRLEQRKYQILKRSRGLQLPQCVKVKPRWQKKHVCFLSHYKVEAGMDARYLADALSWVLNGSAYLDSKNLSNLHLLHNEVCNSEVLLVLATPNILTRPWCLLEIYIAATKDVPVLWVPFDAPGMCGFEKKKAAAFIANIETSLDKVNPGGLATVKELIAQRGVKLDAFKEAIIGVLKQKQGGGKREIGIRWTPHASDNQLAATIINMAERVIEMSGREVEWKQDSKFVTNRWRKGKSSGPLDQRRKSVFGAQSTGQQLMPLTHKDSPVFQNVLSALRPIEKGVGAIEKGVGDLANELGHEVSVGVRRAASAAHMAAKEGLPEAAKQILSRTLSSTTRQMHQMQHSGKSHIQRQLPSVYFSFHAEGFKHAVRMSMAMGSIIPQDQQHAHLLGSVFAVPNDLALNGSAPRSSDLPPHIVIGARVVHPDRGVGVVADILLQQEAQKQVERPVLERPTDLAAVDVKSSESLAVQVIFDLGESHLYFQNSWKKLRPLTSGPRAKRGRLSVCRRLSPAPLPARRLKLAVRTLAGWMQDSEFDAGQTSTARCSPAAAPEPERIRFSSGRMRLGLEVPDEPDDVPPPPPRPSSARRGFNKSRRGSRRGTRWAAPTGAVEEPNPAVEQERLKALERQKEREQEEQKTALTINLAERLALLKRCKLFVFVQTEQSLKNPIVLLELFIALHSNIPICPVFVEGGGYSFVEAQEQLRKCDVTPKELYPQAYSCVEMLIKHEGSSMRRVLWTLLTHIPALISVKLVPGSSDVSLTASVMDILSRAAVPENSDPSAHYLRDSPILGGHHWDPFSRWSHERRSGRKTSGGDCPSTLKRQDSTKAWGVCRTAVGLSGAMGKQKHALPTDGSPTSSKSHGPGSGSWHLTSAVGHAISTVADTVLGHGEEQPPSPSSLGRDSGRRTSQAEWNWKVAGASSRLAIGVFKDVQQMQLEAKAAAAFEALLHDESTDVAKLLDGVVKFQSAWRAKVERRNLIDNRASGRVFEETSGGIGMQEGSQEKHDATPHESAEPAHKLSGKVHFEELPVLATPRSAAVLSDD